MKLRNVGPATADDLILLGVHRLEDLAGKEPDDLFERLCTLTGTEQDPCVWDVFAALIAHANGQPPRNWWEYTPLRKARERKKKA